MVQGPLLRALLRTWLHSFKFVRKKELVVASGSW